MAGFSNLLVARMGWDHLGDKETHKGVVGRGEGIGASGHRGDIFSYRRRAYR